ncbi:MAG: hypothetical protein LBM20_02545 [Rikenellaceae bacterium]|jgi:hypothetical protein|nr:hypothetical protein [Rikenellaceae bacterium]
MAQRDFTNAALHDRVIDAAIKRLNRVEFDIYTNPGTKKNAGILENYPDIIMTKKGTNEVAFIIEVETADSINPSEAEGQWKKYASEIDASFYLLVPEASLKKASDLCIQLGISVRFASYSVDNFNNISIKFM